MVTMETVRRGQRVQIDNRTFLVHDVYMDTLTGEKVLVWDWYEDDSNPKTYRCSANDITNNVVGDCVVEIVIEEDPGW